MRRVLVLVAPLLAAVGLMLATPADAHSDIYPGTDRSPEVWRVVNHDTGDRSTFAVDPDRQPGEKVLRVYVYGRLAERSGRLWFRDVAHPPPGRSIHVRIVTTEENFHHWVRVRRADI